MCVLTDVLGSIWLVQCCTVFRYVHHNAGENPEMRTLFYRLCRLLRLHAIVIFVFDGDERPKIKREKNVQKTPHWLEQGFIEMVRLFGFIVHRVDHPLLLLCACELIVTYRTHLLKLRPSWHASTGLALSMPCSRMTLTHFCSVPSQSSASKSLVFLLLLPILNGCQFKVEG